MAEVTFDVTPATPQKRTHDDCIIVNTYPAIDSATRSTSTERQPLTSRSASPAPSTSSSLSDLTSTLDTPNSAVKPGSTPTSGPPSKKRKLGFIEKEAEKAAKKREKDEKARQKAEEKARKDDEKRVAAEEKEAARRAKELEKAEKQAALDAEKKEKEDKRKAKEAEKKEKESKKEAERQEKEAKKAQDEAEKLKKERSQMRLGAFFAKPKQDTTRSTTPDDVSEGVSSRRSSVASVDMERPILDTIERNTTGPTNPDYEKWIFPFFVPEHTEVAPYNNFKLSRHTDSALTPDSRASACNVNGHFGRPRKRMKRTVPVREVIKNIQASGLDVVELDSTALDALNRASFKYLQFKEDVRPPYQGTWTRTVSPRTTRKLRQNPFLRGLTDVNYEYDSEAEWEPPGDDDEELGDDDEMSDADDAEDEMADFLDDADDTARRKGPLSDLEPISTGLCWVGAGFEEKEVHLEQYRMDFLHDSTKFPIDPFSTKHWTDETKSKTAVKPDPSAAAMQPPRQPLSSLSPNTIAKTKQEVGVDGKPVPPVMLKKASTNGKPPKMIEQEFMAEFKKAVDGSDLTKAGMIEILKKQFPKCSKDAIKDTLGVIAVRVGKKEVEKKWQLVEAS